MTVKSFGQISRKVEIWIFLSNWGRFDCNFHLLLFRFLFPQHPYLTNFARIFRKTVLGYCEQEYHDMNATCSFHCPISFIFFDVCMLLVNNIISIKLAHGYKICINKKDLNIKCTQNWDRYVLFNECFLFISRLATCSSYHWLLRI